MKETSNEYWVAVCVSGLTEKCLREVAEQQGIAASISCELVHQDSLVSQLNLLRTKMHQVRLLETEAQAHEEELPTNQEPSSVVQSGKRFQNFRFLTKEKKTSCFADVEALYSVDNSSFPSNADPSENEEYRADIIKAWKASCFER